MNRKTKLGALIAFAATAPAVVTPQLVSQASAQATSMQPAEYPDVPTGHWAYDAINRLSQAGIIEGLPDGTYRGNKAMTRYEFAVAIARLLDRIPTGGGGTGPGPTVDLGPLTNRVTNLEARPVPDITRQEVTDLIAALRTEFADELARLGVRVTALEERVSNLENRVVQPARLQITPSILHRTGYTNYINSGAGTAGGGRNIFNGANGLVAAGVGGPFVAPVEGGSNAANKKFSYTDLELRLTDRITDRLTASAALRSLGDTREDAWTGDSSGSVYLRELYAVADLSDRSILNLRGLNLILGRQRTRFGQGLLYDNDLAPTDQVHAQFNIGPVRLNALVGTSNNQNISSDNAGDPYINSGSVAAFGFNAGADASGALVGFPNGAGLERSDDNEAMVHGAFNLFRISGQPVSVGVTYQFDAVAAQEGRGIDLTLPLFGRTVGFEYVQQKQYANGGDADDASAYIVTLPLLRSRILDLDASYGKADDEFEYFLSSAANPFARSYGEALFDRPLFLGAPMVAEDGGGAVFMAAKKGYDFAGTLRLPLPLLRRIPLQVRYYSAEGTNDVDLGQVYSIGTTFNVSPGLDLELKYGRYNSDGLTDDLEYYRLGANIGF